MNDPSVFWSILKWVGTTVSVTAAILMAIIGHDPTVQVPIFWLYLIGSILWIVAAIRIEEWSLVAMNVVYAIINIIALIVRII